MYWRRIHAAWFGIQFFLVTAVCLEGVFWLISERSTVLPSSWDKNARKAEFVASWCLGKQAGASNPVRVAIATYLHAAGIQAGYTFFAPNVPSRHRLSLELSYDNGRVEYESPRFRSRAAALPLESLLDRLADDRYEPVREVLVKRLAFSVWREHPDVKKVRAIFGSVNPPGVNEFEQGETETFEPLFSFDFSLSGEDQQ
jgi:hypothetical protein